MNSKLGGTSTKNVMKMIKKYKKRNEMRIVLVVIGILILGGCGKKSNPKYQNSIKKINTSIS